jgi:hypothetical protein
MHGRSNTFDCMPFKMALMVNANPAPSALTKASPDTSIRPAGNQDKCIEQALANPEWSWQRAKF